MKILSTALLLAICVILLIGAAGITTNQIDMGYCVKFHGINIVAREKDYVYIETASGTVRMFEREIPAEYVVQITCEEAKNIVIEEAKSFSN